jgi:uncharacterized protein involved in exopolysaccharide biosynthesis
VSTWESAKRIGLRVWTDFAVRGAFLVAVIVGAGSLLVPPRYTSQSLAFPQVASPQISSSLTSLAAQFGLANFAGGLTLQFYAEVFSSRVTMDSLLLSRYPALGSDSTATLLNELGYTTGPFAKRLERGAKELRSDINVTPDDASGLLRIDVVASSPTLAVEIADSLLAQSNRIIARALVEQASFQRQYLEGRLAEARRELDAREGDLEHFYTANRTYQQSPALVFRESQLRREADASRDLYLSIRQNYEQARLSEARDVPTVSFVQRPVLPYKKTSPRPLLNAVLAAIAVLSIVLAVRLLRRPETAPARS